MRELKFRQRIKPSIIKSYGSSFHYWGYIDEGFVAPLGRNFAFEDSEQYTGLKDKNRAEIYEGDILEFNYPPEGIIRKTIKWSESSACFCVFDGLALFGGLHCKVIGNVYENQELLENAL